MADILRGADAAARAPRDADDTGDNEGEPDTLLSGKPLLQDDCRKQRDHQRHHSGKQRACVSRWSEYQFAGYLLA